MKEFDQGAGIVRNKNKMKYVWKRKCCKTMVNYAIAITLFQLIQSVASNNETKENYVNNILIQDSSTYNLTHNSKFGIEGE